ncbi:MAG: hypothetical protein ACRD1T_21515, partial [Acidimicrobiia bacterium]
MRRTPKELLLALVSYAIASVIFTWPMAMGLGNKLPIDLGDPILTSWLMAWGQESITRGPAGINGIMNAPMFFPNTLVFAFTENLLGLAIPLSPIWFLTHNAALVGGVALLICFTLNGFTAYLLARELKAAPMGAAIA